MGLSRERVRQIEREALIRLREHARIREHVA
jgi:DNA-directed RNA polymerase sigma subunit (sigma70/sigma32)